MFQILVEESAEWPESGVLTIPSMYGGEITVSPEYAQQKANGYLCSEVCFFAGAKEPKLYLNGRAVWRMQIVLILRGFGEVAILGNVDVDAQTGKPVPLSDSEVEQIQERANAIAKRLTHPATTTS